MVDLLSLDPRELRKKNGVVVEEIHDGVDVESNAVRELKYAVPKMLEHNVADHLEFEELRMIGEELEHVDCDEMTLAELGWVKAVEQAWIKMKRERRGEELDRGGEDEEAGSEGNKEGSESNEGGSESEEEGLESDEEESKSGGEDGSSEDGKSGEEESESGKEDGSSEGGDSWDANDDVLGEAGVSDEGSAGYESGDSDLVLRELGD